MSVNLLVASVPRSDDGRGASWKRQGLRTLGEEQRQIWFHLPDAGEF